MGNQTFSDGLVTVNLFLERDVKHFWCDMYHNCLILIFAAVMKRSLQDDINPPKTKMTMEHPAFEDVFPIENGDFPMSYC